jgi:hypothetical protein
VGLEYRAFSAKPVIAHIKTRQATLTISTAAHVCKLPRSANDFNADKASISDLAKLGQTTKIERSTLEQVRARIAFLREKTRDKTNAASYDFEARLAEVKAREDGIRAEKKAAAKARKDAARLEMMKDVDMAETQDMAAMMGFAGFGSSKK